MRSQRAGKDSSVVNSSQNAGNLPSVRRAGNEPSTASSSRSNYSRNPQAGYNMNSYESSFTNITEKVKYSASIRQHSLEQQRTRTANEPPMQRSSEKPRTFTAIQENETLNPQQRDSGLRSKMLQQQFLEYAVTKKPEEFDDGKFEGAYEDLANGETAAFETIESRR